MQWNVEELKIINKINMNTSGFSLKLIFSPNFGQFRKVQEARVSQGQKKILTMISSVGDILSFVQSGTKNI